MKIFCRFCLRTWIAPLALMVVAGMASAEAAAAGKTNVLFLIADDLNCDLHCYGHEPVHTPNIDKLAARGVRFEHAYCQFPLCSPSRSSFMTGRRPNVTKVLKNPGAARFSSEYKSSPNFREALPETITLPQMFRQNGYIAARVGKLYHYGVPGQIGTSGLDDTPSWENVVNPAGRDKAEEDKIHTLIPNSFGATFSWYASEGADVEQTDGLSGTAAVSLLDRYKDRPFFLAVGFFRPHTPYVAPKGYFEPYPLHSIELPKLSPDDRSRTPAAAYLSAKQEQESITDRQRREAIRGYHASITFMDAQVGRVVDALDRLGLAANTVIVMTSDHGYHMYEHGLWQKQSLFENSARVPLIIVAPGARGNGKSTAALAELVDLYPTLADLCGLKPPPYLDGKSLKLVLDDPAASVKDAAFSQVTRHKSPGYSVRTAEWRYTLWDDGKQGEQLYDMKADPGETTNLAGDARYAETVAKLRRKIREYAHIGD